MTPLVIGLDLSLAATGIAVPHSTDPGTVTILTSPRTHVCARLEAIRERIDTFRSGLEVDLWVIEDLPKHVAHGGPELGMVHGVVRTALWPDERVLLVPPATLKTYATGKGNARKDDIRMAIYQRYGVDIGDNNQADAFVLRAIGLDLLGHPLVELPQTHRRALDKLALPAGMVAA